MTVIHPNSISGIASVTSHSNSLYFYESDHSTKLTLNAHVNGNVTGDITATNGTFSGDVTVGGTLTYDDVTNIDSVGVVTARNSLHVTGGSVGIGTDNPQVDLHLHDSTNTRIQFTDDSVGVAAGDGVIMGLNGDDDFFINNRESSKNLLLFTENTERLRIHADGEVEIKGGNAAAGQTPLSVEGNYTSSGNVDIQTWARSGGAVKAAMRYVDADTLLKLGTTTNHGFAFITNTNERLRIRSDGKTLIGGATSPYSEYNGTNSGWNGGHYINVGGSTQWGTLHIADWDDSVTKDSYGGTNIFLSRCKSETIGDHSGGALGANNPIARLLFNGSDGSDFRNAAWIECKIDGTPGSNNMPGLLSFATSSGSGAAPVERLRIDSSGRVLISGQASLTSTALSYPIQVAAASDANAIAIFGRAADDIGELAYYEADKTTKLGELQYRQDHLNLRHRVGDIRFATGGTTERLRIDSAGRMGLGADNPGDYDGEANDFVVRSANHTGITIASSGSNQRCNLYFADGTSGTERYRGAFTYNHNDDSMRVRTAATERIQIYNEGAVRIRGVNRNSTFTVGNASGTVFILDDTQPSAVGTGGKIVFGSKYYTAANTMGTAFIGSYKENAPSNGSNEYEHSLIFGTNSSSGGLSEKMRIRHDGRVHIGDSLGNNHSGMFQVIHEGGGQQTNDCLSFFETNANDWIMKLNSNEGGSASHYHIYFMEEGSARGAITGGHGQNVNYQQGSDYRWKENIVDMTGTEGIDICKRLRPRKYNWIKNREGTGQINTVDGFIAHEVQEAGVLGAVTGEKDAVNEDGSINGQMLDYGQMTPVLAAAIKGLIAKVETLEAQVTALQG